MSQETNRMHDDQNVANVFNTGVSRRKFLAAGGTAVAATAVLAACGSSDKKSSGTTSTKPAAAAPDTTAATGGGNDLATAAFAAGLEVLAVGTYKAALDAATANKLGAVPPAVAEFVKTAMSQHQAHLDAWNDVLTKNGRQKVTEPDKGLKPTVDAAFGKVTDVAGAARLALTLEETAAATYLKAIPTLKDPAAIKLASSIHPIDRQHAAVLYFALGQYPVPDVFSSTDKAAKPS